MSGNITPNTTAQLPYDAPIPVTTGYYLGLIPAYNQVQPLFSQYVSAMVAPYVAIINFCNIQLQTAFDLDTAVGNQLDIIGLWVGASRNVEVPITDVFFSWDTANLGWDQGVWLGPYEESESISKLDDNSYRFLLRAKIARNHWDGTAAGALVAYNIALTGTGVFVKIFDNQNMTMTVYFKNSAGLNAVQKALITGGYIDMKPMGVSITNNLI